MRPSIIHRVRERLTLGRDAYDIPSGENAYDWVAVRRTDLAALVAALEKTGSLESKLAERLNATQHDPWDAYCVKHVFREPSRDDARCLVCWPVGNPHPRTPA